MPITTSARSVRVRNLDTGTSKEAVETFAKVLAQIGYGNRLNSAQTPVNSLAAQGECATATVTFELAEIKDRAVKRRADAGNFEWLVDDNFEGLTILQSPENADIDICAVHGLGGNAFDTWMATTKMWLRDLLPSSNPFKTARIMTFGYNSTLFDKARTDRLQDWADDLLGNVGDVRETPEEQARPMIFVCHSLGGIVGRQAMIRLHYLPEKFPGITLGKCGLLFLSTPHVGSHEADWSDFLVSILEVAAGLQSKSIVDELRTLSPSSVDSTEAFRSMEKDKKVPPFICLCEGNKTKTGGRERMIVTQASAGFFGQTADKILNVDHSGVCKFDHKLDGYRVVLGRLKTLRSKVQNLGAASVPGPDANVQNPADMIPGRPNVSAPYCPLRPKTKFYERNEIWISQEMVGRTEVLDQVARLLQADNDGNQNLIAITGMGGAGKTHILSELAAKHEHHMFFVKAKNEDTYTRALLRIATSIGQELLASRISKCDLANRWASLDHSGRIDAFNDWLQESENQRSLFVFDDIDGFKPEEAMLSAFPKGPGNLIYSSRDPKLLRDLGRPGKALSVSTMTTDETVQLMKSIMAKDESLLPDHIPSAEQLSEISVAVYGHPLAVCRAVIFICDKISLTATNSPAMEFLEILQGSDWESRRDFLDFKARCGRSIMDTFEASFDRMESDKKVYAEGVLILAAFISLDTATGAFTDFRLFLQHDRPWLAELREDLPDFELFSHSRTALRHGLSELEKTSLWSRHLSSSSSLGSLPVHPLWLECIRHRVSLTGRLRWLRQIHLLCDASIALNENVNLFELFQNNALNVAARFSIQPAELSPSERAGEWLSAKRRLNARDHLVILQQAFDDSKPRTVSQ